MIIFDDHNWRHYTLDRFRAIYDRVEPNWRDSPPLNQNDWLELFNKYKNTPEFIQKNFDISLAEFKKNFLLGIFS